MAAMEEVQQKVEEGVQVADGAGRALADIRLVVDEASALIQAISESAESQAAGTERLAHYIEELREIAKETEDQVALSTAAVDELQRLATDLWDAIARFKVEEPEAALVEELVTQPEELIDLLSELERALGEAGGSGRPAADAIVETLERARRELEQVLGRPSPAPQALRAAGAAAASSEAAALAEGEEDEADAAGAARSDDSGSPGTEPSGEGRAEDAAASGSGEREVG